MKTIPYGHQWIDEVDIKEVVKVLRSDWITQGPKIQEFEDALGKYTGTKYAVVVSSGTAALHIACLTAGIKESDEVITSPLTFVASANCVLYCGGKPIFADIQEDTFNISPIEIEKLITQKTKAIIPVHFAGHSCDMKRIKQIARKNKLLIIEDAAHALGAKYRNSKVGSCRYSDMTILSFHPVKHITTGEGGAVLTNNKKLYKKLLILRNHGITKEKYLDKPDGDWYYEMQLLGFNYRLTDIQAALGLSQLTKLDKFVKRRREIAAVYNQVFRGNDYFDLPIEHEGVYSSYHLYPVRLKKRFLAAKKDIFSKLRENGVGVQAHYRPVYRQPYYQQLAYLPGLCPQAEKFYRSEISLPLYPLMSNKDINFVVNKINKVLKKF